MFSAVYFLLLESRVYLNLGYSFSVGLRVSKVHTGLVLRFFREGEVLAIYGVTVLPNSRFLIRNSLLLFRFLLRLLAPELEMYAGSDTRLSGLAIPPL